jgi:hypothetical protein
MSYVNLPPEVTFTRLERILQSQRRMLFLNVSATVLFAGSVLASLASLL